MLKESNKIMSFWENIKLKKMLNGNENPFHMNYSDIQYLQQLKLKPKRKRGICYSSDYQSKHLSKSLGL